MRPSLLAGVHPLSAGARRASAAPHFEHPRRFRGVLAAFDGFFFPYRTHLGYNLFYQTPPRRRGRPYPPALGVAHPAPRPTAPLTPTPPQKLRQGGLPSTQALRRMRRPGVRFSARAPSVTTLLGAAVSAAHPRPKPHTHLLHNPLLWGSTPTPLRGEVPPTAGPSPFASYEESMQRWSLIAARFRPGIATEWRRCRRAFNEAWGLGLARQHRLTRFVLSLRHF